MGVHPTDDGMAVVRGVMVGVQYGGLWWFTCDMEGGDSVAVEHAPSEL